MIIFTIVSITAGDGTGAVDVAAAATGTGAGAVFSESADIINRIIQSMNFISLIILCEISIRGFELGFEVSN
jgi:hypothetical protein